MRPDKVQVRQGNKLPHWTRDGATYAVTFRLADSIPEAAAAKLRLERERLEQEAANESVPTLERLTRLARLKSDLTEKYLHAGHGECLLSRHDCAEVVAVALGHFDGKRYRLHAWCVMPNHVHVVLSAFPGERLEKILHSWKSFTSKAIGKLIGRSGQIWQAESYDHIVRDDVDLAHCIQYALDNPLVAGLRDWKWVWPVERRQSRP